MKYDIDSVIERYERVRDATDDNGRYPSMLAQMADMKILADAYCLNRRQMFSELSRQVLVLLRQRLLTNGECYYGITAIAGELGCTPAALYDYENDTGVLIDLDFAGDVQLIRGRDASVTAMMTGDPWG